MMKKKILISTIVLIFSIVCTQSQYQILSIPKDAYSISSNDGFSSLYNVFDSSNPASQNNNKINNYSLVYFPADIKFANFKINNFSLSILNYGTIKEEIDNVVLNQFTANEYSFSYKYNWEIINQHPSISLRFGLNTGFYYSQIDNFNSYGIVSSVGLSNLFKNINLSIGLSVNNLGMSLKNYSNSAIDFPTYYSFNFAYKYKNMLLGYTYKKNQYLIDDEHIAAIKFIIKSNIYLNFSTTSYAQNLVINDNDKYFYGSSIGIGYKINSYNIYLGLKNIGISGNILAITISNTF